MSRWWIVGVVVLLVAMLGAAVALAGSHDSGQQDSARPEDAGMPPFLTGDKEMQPGLAKRDALPPGLAKKEGDWVPPGLAKKGGDRMPPGLAKNGKIPPGHARRLGVEPTG